MNKIKHFFRIYETNKSKKKTSKALKKWFCITKSNCAKKINSSGNCRKNTIFLSYYFAITFFCAITSSFCNYSSQLLLEWSALNCLQNIIVENWNPNFQITNLLVKIPYVFRELNFFFQKIQWMFCKHFWMFTLLNGVSLISNSNISLCLYDTNSWKILFDIDWIILQIK